METYKILQFSKINQIFLAEYFYVFCHIIGAHTDLLRQKCIESQIIGITAPI